MPVLIHAIFTLLICYKFSLLQTKDEEKKEVKLVRKCKKKSKANPLVKAAQNETKQGLHKIEKSLCEIEYRPKIK